MVEMYKKKILFESSINKKIGLESSVRSAKSTASLH